MPTQDEIFTASEADRWFERNKHVLGELPADDIPARLVELYRLRPRSILEIGAANGYRVAELAKRTGARGVAIEPSAAAIADGAQRFSHVTFHQGEARALPVEQTFELVIVNFVLHWIDRKNLLRCAAEIDRVVADGGHLVLGDFHPWRPARNVYHHLPDAGVMTFKQDYAQLFLASELYQPVALLTSHGRELDASVADGERYGVSLLRKRL
ncbi:MAG: class I SAM-dependent methyltransferase [Deltaproteobacteria bacterium]|nr:class I SAM-dependent methyltransferase [Deltaproteobacteria bacterium]